jgi:hypothetical protein
MWPVLGTSKVTGLATAGTVRARPVQLRFETQLTSTEYVTRQAWGQAMLVQCPLHPRGACGVSRHGTYDRVEPPGARVVRYYCRAGHTTFSLRPDCLASRLSSSQDEVEQVVVAAEQAPSQEVAAARLRPDIGLQGALRWLRRRLGPVRTTVLALVTLVPALMGSPAQLRSVRRALGTDRALVALRGIADTHLRVLPPPIGFGPRSGAP